MQQGNSSGRQITNVFTSAVEAGRKAIASSNYAAVPSSEPPARAQPRLELVDESSIEALWWSHDDAPGLYKIISDRVAVSSTLNLGGPILTELPIGSLVKVEELSNCPGRLRGLIEEDGDIPRGWISIQNLHSDRRWAMRLVVPTQVPLLSFDGNARNMQGLQSCCSVTRDGSSKVIDTEDDREDARPDEEVDVSHLELSNHGSCWLRQQLPDEEGRIGVVVSKERRVTSEQLAGISRSLGPVIASERSYSELPASANSCTGQLLPVKMFTI
mmetsp:Transcript_57415/g.134650  ORF Transcript_57415/g.134650 Transcript_57415/m.134650 type:complete len:272 (-) Transcript_57415:2-817(-)